MSNFGHDRERQVVALLRDDDWIAFRAPGSLGCADVIAMREGSRNRLIEVKATAAGPYAGFLPADRAKLAATAQMAGAVAELCWWPKRAKPVFIGESEWP